MILRQTDNLYFTLKLPTEQENASVTITQLMGGDYRGDGGDASPKKNLLGGTQTQASPNDCYF